MRDQATDAYLKNTIVDVAFIASTPFHWWTVWEGARPCSSGTSASSASARGYPPDSAPTIMNGSAPDATASGNGASGPSNDRSSSQAKNRRNGRRLSVA